MSEWIYINANEVLHESGFRLELISGTWQTPHELNPVAVKTDSSITTVGLISQALKFAKRQNAPKKTIRIEARSSLVA